MSRYRVTVTWDVTRPSQKTEVEARSFRRAAEKVCDRPSSEYRVGYLERHAIPTRRLAHAVTATFSGRTEYVRVDLLE
jgi:hypothetical protein